MENYREKAILFVQNAIKADNEGNYKEAFNLYIQSCEWFKLCIKYEKNPAAAEKLRDKVMEYVKRAEQLKNQEKTPTVETFQTLSIKPNVSWDSVIGLETAKNILEEIIFLPTERPELFTDIKPWKGVLLYGPPGTGKSYLAKAVATRSNRTFFAISSADLKSKYVGESENLVRNLFHQARETRPSIIFIDEIDSLCGSRDQDGNNQGLKTEFLVQMDGVGNDQTDVLVIGATNVPWTLDHAIRSRFAKRIYIPLPTREDRIKMFLQARIESSTLVSLTDNYSGRDIANLIEEIKLQPIRSVSNATHFKRLDTHTVVPCEQDDAEAVKMTWKEVDKKDLIVKPQISEEDCVKAVLQIRSSVSLDDIKKQEEWTKEFGIK